MTPADWLSLMAICSAYSDYLKACEVLQAEGMIIGDREEPLQTAC
jgi:phage terminase small subunit